MYKETEFDGGKNSDKPMKRYAATFKSKKVVSTWQLCQTANNFYGTFKYDNRHAIYPPSDSVIPTEFCAGMFFRGQDDRFLSVVYIDTNMVKDHAVIDKFLSALHEVIEKKLNS